MATSQGELASDPAAGLRDALRAYRLWPDPEAERAVRSALDADNELRVLRPGHGLVVASEFARDGRTILTAGLDGTAKLFDAATGKRLRTFGQSLGPASPLTGGSFSPDGSMVVSAAMNGTVHVYDTATGRHVADSARTSRPRLPNGADSDVAP